MKLIILFALLLGGCNRPLPSPEAEDVSCSVVRYTVAGSTVAVCAVECRWSHHSKGYTNSIAAPCEWAGKKVTRQ